MAKSVLSTSTDLLKGGAMPTVQSGEHCGQVFNKGNSRTANHKLGGGLASEALSRKRLGNYVIN